MRRVAAPEHFSARALGGGLRREASLGLALSIGLAVSTFAAQLSAQTPIGTWTAAPSNPATGGPAFGLWLMTDGRVLSHGANLNDWVLLTPDRKGSYANGTWKQVASSAYARGGAQEHVLSDGRFLEAGGEYIYTCPAGVANCTMQYNTVEIFDPIANTWTLGAPGLFGDIGDTGSATLADGTILESHRSSNTIQIYDPKTNMWTQKSKSVLATGDESAWAALQNGGVLAVGPNTDGAAVYDPASDAWTRTGVPSGFDMGDTGGITLMFDGRVFVYGLAGKSFIYTPGPTPKDPGSWVAGPAMLNGGEAEDEYSDCLPNGMVVGALVQKTYGPGVVWQQFDPTTGLVTSIQPPPDPGNPYPISYVNLPNGQVMVDSEAQDGPDWILTLPDGPQDAWRPKVTSVVYQGNDKYTLTGTQITGLINGGDEGDDMTMAENYPIVWLKDASGDVHYCRTFNISHMAPSRGDTPETCDFTIPAGLPAGTYELYVSAVGVPSNTPVSFTVGIGTGGPDSGIDSGSGSGHALPDAGVPPLPPDASATNSADASGADGGVAREVDDAALASEDAGGSRPEGPITSPIDAASGEQSGRPAASAGCGCAIAEPSSGGWTWLWATTALVIARVGRRRRSQLEAGDDTGPCSPT